MISNHVQQLIGQYTNSLLSLVGTQLFVFIGSYTIGRFHCLLKICSRFCTLVKTVPEIKKKKPNIMVQARLIVLSYFNNVLGF